MKCEERVLCIRKDHLPHYHIYFRAICVCVAIPVLPFELENARVASCM